jgi:carbamoyltransferase
MSSYVFLNCPSNRALVDHHPNTNLFFMPAAHDEGQSIGASAYAYWKCNNELPLVDSSFPYLGFSYTPVEIEAEIKDRGLRFKALEAAERAQHVADLLQGGQVIGVLQGRTETGPRALGHRSILADPRTLESKHKLDMGIKGRAEFRPYAPMVRQCDIKDWFIEGGDSPFMLLTANVRPHCRELIPAVTHVDGSARPQSVSPQDDSFLFNTLSHFAEHTGVPILLNTSFNRADEPIVETPGDALNTFLSTELDAVLLENYLVLKPE